ncbi:MAG: hypothetical protein AAF533_30020 [Acidobacteriota bacterium]
MTHLLGLAALAVAGVALGELTFGAYELWSRRAYTRVRRTASTRSQFAPLRRELVQLAWDGELDSGSPRFHQLYWLYSHLMRHPQRYPKLADAFASEILKATGSRDQGPAIAPAIALPLLRRTAHAFKHLIREHASIRGRASLWLAEAALEAQRELSRLETEGAESREEARPSALVKFERPVAHTRPRRWVPRPALAAAALALSTTISAAEPARMQRLRDTERRLVNHTL